MSNIHNILCLRRLVSPLITDKAKCARLLVCNSMSTRRYRYVRKPEKPKTLPPAGSATSLAAEIIARNDESKISSNCEVENNIDEIKTLAHNIESIPALVETEQYNEESLSDSITSSDKSLAEIPKGNAIFDMFGKPDITVPISDVPCPGCGAKMHCQDASIPGYMPKERFLSVTKRRLREQRCQRCVLIQDYDVALNVTIDPDEYSKIVSRVSESNGLAIVIVDLLDMPASIYRVLPEIIATSCPIYIVGNKVDMVPKDDAGYLRRIHSTLIRHCREIGLITSSVSSVSSVDDTTSSKRRVKHIALVSAKTGYGIEDLVTHLLCKWKRKGDVYIMGCTNVGKSTLYNSLLASDYCKSTARDFIGRATTSIWPGTTLNTLKFPIMKPTEKQLQMRSGRLNKDLLSEGQSDRVRHGDLVKYGRLKDATLMGLIGQTFIGVKDEIDKKRKLQHSTSTTYNFNETKNKVEEGELSSNRNQEIKKQQRLNDEFDISHYDKSNHCIDTPGVVNPEQIINMLNPQELSILLSDRLIRPRTWILTPGDTIFISGLSRIDYLKGTKSAYFTVFSAGSLPIVHCKTSVAQQFYEENIGSSIFSVPVGDDERIKEIPKLKSKDFTFVGQGWRKSVGDIILSSIGWVSVTYAEDINAEVRAYTPSALGLTTRYPSMVPYAVNMRGKRNRKSKSYCVRRIYA